MPNILTDIFDFVLPRFCAMCGERLTPHEHCLCINCLRHLPYTYSHLHPKNEIEKKFWYHIPIERAASYLFYEGEGLRNAIHLFKYKRRPDVGYYFAKMMTEEYMASGFFEGIDVIIPLPLHWKKHFKRGYNQCHYIAQAINEKTGIPVDSRIVKRVVNNTAQASLHHENRHENVEDIFRVCHPERLQGKHVLLVDDIMTTGSTIMSCALEIAKVPDVRISILSLAYAGEQFMLTSFAKEEKSQDNSQLFLNFANYEDR